MKFALVFSVTFVCLVVYTSAAKEKVDILRDEYLTLGTKVDFYDEVHHGGLSTHVETDGPCKNLPRRWAKRAKSADTRGTCVAACEERDCQGVCKRIYPAVGEQKLSEVGMDKKISSIQGCFV